MGVHQEDENNIENEHLIMELISMFLHIYQIQLGDEGNIQLLIETN